MSKLSEDPEPAAEFSRLLDVGGLGTTLLTKRISANEAECVALARRLGLLNLDNLSASLRVQRVPGSEVIRVSGRFETEAAQACVVSLEPVPVSLSEEFNQLYAPAPETPQPEDQVIDAVAEDPPEEIGAEGIDLGEAVVQQFAQALDPYPRAPEARLPAGSEEALEAARDMDGPFAALKALKAGR